MKLSDFLQDIGRPIVFYPLLAEALGGIKESIFVSQILYWQGRGENQEWIYKSAEEFQSEIYLTYKEQILIRKKLKELGVLLEKYDRSSHRMFFKIDTAKLNAIWRSTCPKVSNHLTKSQIPPTQKSVRIRNIDDTKMTHRNKGRKTGFASAVSLKECHIQPVSATKTS